MGQSLWDATADLGLWVFAVAACPGGRSGAIRPCPGRDAKGGSVLKPSELWLSEL